MPLSNTLKLQEPPVAEPNSFDYEAEMNRLKQVTQELEVSGSGQSSEAVEETAKSTCI